MYLIQLTSRGNENCIPRDGSINPVGDVQCNDCTSDFSKYWSRVVGMVSVLASGFFNGDCVWPVNQTVLIGCCNLRLIQFENVFNLRVVLFGKRYYMKRVFTGVSKGEKPLLLDSQHPDPIFQLKRGNLPKTTPTKPH